MYSAHFSLGAHSAATFIGTLFERQFIKRMGDDRPEVQIKRNRFATLDMFFRAIGSCCRVATICNIGLALLPPVSRAANIAIFFGKWTISALWALGSDHLRVRIAQIPDATRSKFGQFFLRHGETTGQLLAVAATVALAVMRILGPVGIALALIGPTVHFASMAFPPRRIAQSNPIP